MSSKIRFSLSLAILAAVVSAALGVAAHRESANERTQAALDAGALEIEASIAPLEAGLAVAREDASILSRLADLGSYIRSGQDGTTDPGTRLAAESWRTEVERDFIGLAQARADYASLRYIDRTGRERIRVERADGGVVRASEADLGNESSEAWFARAMESPPRAVYTSPALLVRRKGGVRFPQSPVVRFAAPVAGSGDQKAGLAVVELDPRRLLELIGIRSGTVYVADEEGAYLRHPDPTLELGYGPSPKARLSETSSPGALGHGVRRIRYAASDPDRSWTVAWEVPAGAGLGPGSRLVRVYVPLAIVLAMAGGALGWFWSSRFSKPIETLAETARRLSTREAELRRALERERTSRAGLEMLLARARGAVPRLEAAAALVVSAAKRQASAAKDRIAGLAGSRAAVDDALRTAEQSVRWARDVAGSAQNAAQVGESATRSAREASSTVEGIGELTRSVAEHVLEVAEQSRAVGDLAAAAGEIAERANLVALNAAIATSRAGEDGRCFATVAAEAKVLADETKDAAIRVHRILSGLRTATRTAVVATEAGTRGLLVAGGTARRARESMEELSLTLLETARAGTRTSAAAGRQASALSGVAGTLARLAVSSDRGLGSTRLTERLAEEMHALAAELDRTLSKNEH